MTEKFRRAISVAIISEGKGILLVREGEVWKLPGGKPEPDETDIDCLRREVREEINGAGVDNLRPFDTFRGITPNVGDVLEVEVYLASLIATDIIEASGEIDEVRWFNQFDRCNLPDITGKIISALQNKELL